MSTDRSASIIREWLAVMNQRFRLACISWIAVSKCSWPWCFEERLGGVRESPVKIANKGSTGCYLAEKEQRTTGIGTMVQNLPDISFFPKFWRHVMTVQHIIVLNLEVPPPLYIFDV